MFVAVISIGSSGDGGSPAQPPESTDDKAPSIAQAEGEIPDYQVVYELSGIRYDGVGQPRDDEWANKRRTQGAMDHRSFPDQLVFSIGLAVSRSRNLLRRMIGEHATDDVRQQLAERIVQDLEHSGFELDEEGQALRMRPPTRPHG